MAKKKADSDSATVNKSKAVRDYVTANPDAMPKEVADALTKDGVDVSAQFVSQIKYQMKLSGSRKAGEKRGGGRSAGGRGRGQGPLTADELIKVKNLVDELGGEDRVQEALTLLKKLR